MSIILVCLTAISYLVAGRYFYHRGAEGFGISIGVAGLLWVLQYATVIDIAPMPVIGVMANATFCVVVVRSLVDFVIETTRSLLVRFVHAGVLGIPITSTVLFMFSRPQWAGYASGTWWPTLFANRHVLGLSVDVCAALDALLLASLTIVLISHLRVMKWLDRLSVSPILACGVALLIAMATLEGAQVTSNNVIANYFAAPPAMLSIFALLIPIGLIIADLRRTTVSANIMRTLSSSLRDGGDIEAALRQAFRDASIAFPSLDNGYLAIQKDTISVAASSCDLAQQNMALRSHLVNERIDIECARISERERLVALVDQTLAPRLQSALKLLKRGNADDLHKELADIIADVRNLRSH